MNNEKCPVYPELCDPQRRENCWLYRMYRQQDSYGVLGEDPDGDPRVQFATPEKKQAKLNSIVVFAHDNECPQANNIVDDDPSLLAQAVNEP